MAFFRNTQVPQIGDKIQITIPGSPGFVLEVAVVARWVPDQLGVPNLINFSFLLPRDTFPLELARRVVILDTAKEQWFILIKDGENAVSEEVTVKIICD